MNRMLMRAALLCVPLLWSATSIAVPVNFYLEGTVTAADGGNVFGLAVGDTVVARGMYDDIVIAPGGDSSVEYGDAGNSFGAMLTLFVGGVTLFEYNDIDFLGDIFPTLAFLNGAFTGFDFVAEVGLNGAAVNFDIEGLNFLGQQGLAGAFSLDTLRITPKAVPEPASAWLGALALAGLQRSRRARRGLSVSARA